ESGCAKYSCLRVYCQIGDGNIWEVDIVQHGPACPAVYRAHHTEIIADVDRGWGGATVECNGIARDGDWRRDISPGCSSNCCAKDILWLRCRPKAAHHRINHRRIVRVKDYAHHPSIRQVSGYVCECDA